MRLLLWQSSLRTWLASFCLTLCLSTVSAVSFAEPNFQHYQLFGYDFRYTKHDQGLTFGGYLDPRRDVTPRPNEPNPAPNSPDVIPPPAGDALREESGYSIPFSFDFNKRFPVIDMTTRIMLGGDHLVYPFIDIEQSFAYPGGLILGTALGAGLQYRPCDSITIEGFVKPYWQMAPSIMGFYTRFSGMRETSSLYDEPIAPQLVTMDGDYGLTTGIFFVYRW